MIGVSTIVLVIAIGIGAQKKIEEQYANLAVTSILINPVASTAQKSKLSEDDVPVLKNESTLLASVTAILQGKMTASSDLSSASATLLGIGTDFLDISKLDLEK